MSAVTLMSVPRAGGALEPLSSGELDGLLRRVIRALEGEDSSWRPESFSGQPGGLVDLVAQVLQLPTIIVPDLHARWRFFQRVLDYVPDHREYWPQCLGLEGLSVLDLLGRGLVNLVCVGDGLHSELHRDRWLEAQSHYVSGRVLGAALEEEMAEGLGLMAMVMECKAAFSARFHFLKGNHENIMNRWAGGDRPFRKFAREGEMARRFMEELYGEEVLQLYGRFETLLPLCVAAPRCLISHSEPRRAFSRRQVVDALEDGEGEAVYGLTWTGNGESQDGAVATMLEEFLPQWWNGGQPVDGGSLPCLYFGGHRTISESYRLRQEGRYVQIHNPRLQQVAVVPVHRPFDFGRDLVCLGGED